MNLNICLTGNGYTEAHFEQLRAIGFHIDHRIEPMSQSDLQRDLPEFDAYVLGGDERLTEAELNVARRLKVISFVGTGYTSFIDAQAAKQHGIRIKNTPAVMAPAVAEHTLGLILGLQRRLFAQNWLVKHDAAEAVQTQELSAQCVGIVGMGEIGSRVAKMLRQSFDCEVIYASRSRKLSLESTLNIRAVSMETLFSTADIIVLALPTTPETTYFVNDALLSKTKKNMLLVNTAGAKLVEPNALKAYLDSNHIAAAAFDGYYIEPLPKIADDPYGLLSLPDHQFVVTPHAASKTKQSWTRMVDMAIENVVECFSEATCAG